MFINLASLALVIFWLQSFTVESLIMKTKTPLSRSLLVSTAKTLSFDHRLLPGLMNSPFSPNPYGAIAANAILYIGLKSSKQQSLTEEGLLHSAILGVGLWTFLGFKGWALCVCYLIFGSLVTKIKMKEKEKLGIAEKRQGKRGPENVWGSASVAMLCSILSYIAPAYSDVFKVVMLHH